MVMPDLERAVEFVRRHRGYFLILVFILLLSGVNLVVLPQKAENLGYVGIVLFLSGMALLVLAFMPEKSSEKPRESLANRIMRFFAVRLRMGSFFPILGAALIALDVAYNLLVFGGLYLGTHDNVLIFFGAVLVAYNFVPESYEREKDFLLILSGVLVLILVIPLILMRAFQGDFDAGVNAYSAVFLVPEANAILNLLGIQSWAGTDPSNLGIPTLYFPSHLNIEPLGVTTSCSGIYSFSIFAGAFTAFILTEYNEVNRRVGALLVLGFVTSYVANLLRIVIVVLVGVWAPGDDPMESLLQAHSNLGWMIFVLWITVFWLIMYKVLMKEKPAEPAVEETRKRGTLCGICGDVLSPSIPGVRCSCGRFYHAECLEEAGNCPACNTAYSSDEAELPGQVARGAKGLS